MSSLVGMSVVGLDELHAAFQSVTRGMRNAVLRRAVIAGGKVLISPLRQASPVADQLYGKQLAKNAPGTLRRSVGHQYKRTKGGDVHTDRVGPRKNAAWGQWLEFGTKDRVTGTGHSTGRVTPKPYFSAVYASHLTQIQAKVKEALIAGLQAERLKALNRAMKKSGL